MAIWDWARDELLLTLNLYLNRKKSLTAHDPDVEDLSEQLRSMPSNQPKLHIDGFRSPSAVSFSVNKYRRMEVGTGNLADIGEPQKAVWKEYCSGTVDLPQELRRIANSETSLSASIEHDVSDLEFAEGNPVLRSHFKRERSAELTRLAKEQWGRDSMLRCHACGFDFGATYGSLGASYVEAHHEWPLSKYEPHETTRVEDLVPVCANCHRMIHRANPILSVAQLRELLVARGRAIVS